LNVHKVSNVSQIEIHAAEPLVPGPSPFEVQIATAKFRKYKSPGSHQILAQAIHAGGEYYGLIFINANKQNKLHDA
jgi:hypothetical protein